MKTSPEVLEAALSVVVAGHCGPVRVTFGPGLAAQVRDWAGVSDGARRGVVERVELVEDPLLEPGTVRVDPVPA